MKLNHNEGGGQGFGDERKLQKGIVSCSLLEECPWVLILCNTNLVASATIALYYKPSAAALHSNKTNKIIACRSITILKCTEVGKIATYLGFYTSSLIRVFDDQSEIRHLYLQEKYLYYS